MGYLKRLPKNYLITITEIPPLQKSSSFQRNEIAKLETNRLLSATLPNSTLIALDERGTEWTTVELSKKITTWQQQSISIIIGGANGLNQAALQKCHLIWSLSKLTLPHQLVRVLLVEQLYRAWSIINQHPYHRN